MGRPLFAYSLNWLAASGVPRTVICANSETGAFRKILGSGVGFGGTTDYYEDRMPRGPAGCLRDAAAAVSSDIFIVVDGSLVTDIELEPIIAAHETRRAAVTVVAVRCGGGAAREDEILEPAGIYVVSRSALEHVPRNTYQDIKEMWLPRLYASGVRVVPFVVERGECMHVSGTASYFALHDWLVAGKPPVWWGGFGYRQIGRAWVHKSARLAPGVRFEGACVVGPGCRVESGTSVFGTTVIGASSRLERNAIVNRSIVWSGCQVGAQAVVDHSVVAGGISIKRGDVLRNQIVSAYDAAVTPLRAAQETYWSLLSPETRVGPPAFRGDELARTPFPPGGSSPDRRKDRCTLRTA
jgi:NDP-sugar pyrophosphorylase family protein